MATQATIIQNLLKVRYGDLHNRIPSDNYLMKNIQFDSKKLGHSKEIAVTLGNPQNHSYASRDDGAFKYKEATTVKNREGYNQLLSVWTFSNSKL